MTDLERAILHIKTRADAWAVKEIEKALSQEPCDNAVSREAVIEAITQHMDGEDKNCKLQLSSVVEWIRDLPPVTHKSGKWEGIDEEPHEDYECSCCGYVVSTFTANIEPHTEYKYCPNCGAKMESEDKE